MRSKKLLIKLRWGFAKLGTAINPRVHHLFGDSLIMWTNDTQRRAQSGDRHNFQRISGRPAEIIPGIAVDS